MKRIPTRSEKKGAGAGIWRAESFAIHSPKCIVAASSHAEARHLPSQARLRRGDFVLDILCTFNILDFHPSRRYGRIFCFGRTAGPARVAWQARYRWGAAGSTRHRFHGELRGAKIRHSFGDAVAHGRTTVPARGVSRTAT